MFEQAFDFEAYMENRLLAIEDLGERMFARQFLVPALRQIMHESERSFQRLEDRVYAEIPMTNDKHHVYMTVVQRERYDITNGAWFPLLADDEKPWGDRKVLANTEKSNYIDRVFYCGDGEALDQIAEAGPFSGTVQTKAGTLSAQFRLVPTERYQEQVEHMYRLFRANGLRWTTLNCGYLLRFFDVQLVEVEGGRSENEILDYTVSFGPLEDRLLRDRIPVWNVQKILYDSKQFTVPVINSAHHEHIFPADVFGEEHGYLLEGNEDILSLRHTEDQIVIITAKETFKKWVAYQVIYRPPSKLSAFELPILHNAPKDSFVTRYMAHDGRAELYSKLEITRQVEQYDLMGLLVLQDVTLIHDAVDPFDPAHMSTMNIAPAEDLDQAYLNLRHLNWFIQDDWRNLLEQKVLLFHFRSVNPHFLQYDLLCFFISQLQQQFNEYRCEAVLELGGEAL